MQATVGGVDGDACFPKRVDESGNISPCDADPFGRAGAARGEEYIGELVVGCGSPTGNRAVGVWQLGSIDGLKSFFGRAFCQGRIGRGVEQTGGLGLLDDVEVARHGLQGVQRYVGASFHP